MVQDILKKQTGKKQQFLVPVYDTGLQVPVTVIDGVDEGETLLITAGVHCSEYTGIEAAIELANELLPEQIKGRVIIVNPLNYSGFLVGNYNSRVPEDNKNLNRVFPGRQEGSISEQIADFLVTLFQSQADYYIDMHGGNTQEELSPYVYYVTVATKEVSNKAKEMACRVNVDYMVGSKVGSQGAYNYAGSTGIPSILLERGCSGVWKSEEVDQYKQDIKNVMRYLSILQDNQRDEKYNPNDLTNVYYCEAKETGFWYPTKKAGEAVEKGELAGTIKDSFGNLLETIYFEENGIILYQTCSLCIKQGDEAVVYGK